MVSCHPLFSRRLPVPHFWESTRGNTFFLLKSWEILKFSLLSSLVINFTYFLTDGGYTDFVNIYCQKEV